MQDEVLDRGNEVPESGLDLGPRLLGGARPAAERRFHADEDVLNRAGRFRVRLEHIAIVLCEGPHPILKLSVCGAKACLNEACLRLRELVTGGNPVPVTGGVGWSAAY